MSVSFSVLIPAYNCEKTIVRCLQSIWRQNYLNYRIYVINDCSTDGTKQILDCYHKQGKIYFLQHRDKNAGSVVGRKQLLQLAKQDYILFIDNDDQFAQGAFQVYADLINKHALDIIITDFYVNKLNPNAVFRDSQVDQQVIVKQNVFDYSFNLFHHFLLWNKAIKSQVVKKIYVPDTVIFGCDDHMFSLQLYLNANSLGVFRTQANYIHYYGAGQWGNDMDEQTMHKFCRGYRQTLLFNLMYILNNKLDYSYFIKVYNKYEASYLRILAGDNQKLLEIYDSYFNHQFFCTIDYIMRICK